MSGEEIGTLYQGEPEEYRLDDNCWKTVRADRVAFLVDTAAYFRAFKAAAMQARHNILIVGWDVNSRTLLEFADEARSDVPNELGPLLNYLAASRENLEINVLCWDSPLFYRLEREWMVRARFDWFTHPSMHFVLDDQHPIGASHHQKIVVIDDSIAFVGGIDLTTTRLDTTEHIPGDQRRTDPSGALYAPFHDVQIAVSGAAAEAIAELARDRWHRATGQRIRAAKTGTPCWPDHLAPDLSDIDVSIARTYGAWKGRGEVREIEKVFLDIVTHARETIYIENQYLTATRVGSAIIDRLNQPDCPEFVVVLPQDPTGWLEQTAMGINQRQLLARIRDADKCGRFRVYIPVVGKRGEVPVKVHAKTLIADGQLLFIGSANLNNRSMGLDTECNLAIEGEPGSPAATAIETLRDRLIAEHLDLAVETVAKEIRTKSSLIGAIDTLRGPGRSLIPFTETPPGQVDAIVADSAILDPEETMKPEMIADELAHHSGSKQTFRGAIFRLASVLLALFGLAALWRWTPMSEFVNVSGLVAWVEALRADGTSTAIFMVGYVVLGMIMFPVLVLITATGLLYGPVTGLLIAASCTVTSAMLGYALGVVLGRRALHRTLGRSFERANQHLARRGLLAMVIIRLLPLAPFSMINFAAGASHISFRDFVLGTILGMAPGTLALTLFSGQLSEVVRNPDVVNIGILAALLLAIFAAAIWSWRRFLH